MRYRVPPEDLDLARYWLVLGAVSIGGYAVLEGYALARGTRSRGTLSYHLRYALGIHPYRRWGAAARAAWVGGCMWLAYHIAVDTEHGPVPMENRRTMACCTGAGVQA